MHLFWVKHLDPAAAGLYADESALPFAYFHAHKKLKHFVVYLEEMDKPIEFFELPTNISIITHTQSHRPMAHGTPRTFA